MSGRARGAAATGRPRGRARDRCTQATTAPGSGAVRGSLRFVGSTPQWPSAYLSALAATGGLRTGVRVVNEAHRAGLDAGPWAFERKLARDDGRGGALGRTDYDAAVDTRLGREAAPYEHRTFELRRDRHLWCLSLKRSVPGRRIVHPGAPEHGRDDLYFGQLLGRARDRVAIDDDQVGVVARKQLAAAPLVAGEPGRIDRRGLQRLLDREGLFGVPRRPLVERAQDSRADAGERVELLDWCIRAVRNQRSRVPERAERIGVCGLARPERVGEIAVGRRVRELHRGRDP